MIIYKITNLINNKVYIGQTTKTIEWRFNKHCEDAMKNINTTIHIQRAILRYGKENFKIEQIDTASSKNELNEKEKYWIRYYNSKTNGYNMTYGGEGGDTYSSLSDEEMNCVKQKIGTKNRGKLNGQSKQIKCYSVKIDKELFFDTISDCLKYFNVKNKSFIQLRIEGKLKSLWRDEWKFAYQDKEYEEYFIFDASTRKGKKVKLIINEQEYVFNSKNKAIEFLNSTKKKFEEDAEKLNYQIIYP